MGNINVVLKDDQIDTLKMLALGLGVEHPSANVLSGMASAMVDHRIKELLTDEMLDAALIKLQVKTRNARTRLYSQSERAVDAGV